ncbi:hypothetical protein JCM6882_000972 [Rhodosporidiobolus microsporus]
MSLSAPSAPTTALSESGADETGARASPARLEGADGGLRVKEDGGGAREGWEESLENPRNWEMGRKWVNTLTIALTGFLSTTGSSIFVPAASLIRNEFNVSQEVVTLTTALYVLGLGFGPFVFAPISELYGRQRAYSTSQVGFTAMNLGCCFVKGLPGLIVLRFLAGFFGSSGPGLGVATISDLFEPKKRGRPMSIYAIGPMLGPVLGSIIGHYLVLPELHTWRWPFRLLTILTGLNTLAIVFLMRETYGPVCERAWRAKREAEREGKGGVEKEGRKELAKAKPSKGQAREVIKRTFTRPPRMLMNPVCTLFSTYYAYVYSIIYVFLVSLPLLFDIHNPPTGIFSYNWPAGTAGLPYIGLGIGFLSAAFTAATFQDRIYKALSRRYGNNGEPEYRLVITQLGMLIFPAGLFIWGWTAQSQTHWIGPVIGSCIFAYGLMLAFNSIQNFIVDAFFPYSAAAMSVATLLRSITGTVLPIFAPRMFINLGYGWGGTLLALVTLPAVPAPVILFLMGGRLRERWKFKE